MTEKSIYANQTVVVQRGDRMEHEIDRIECAIRHIESSFDVDPWACEIAVHAMRELIKRTETCPEFAKDINVPTNDDTISRKSVIDAVHTATYGFICGAEDGDEMTDEDKLVLSINKAICTAIKALPTEPNTFNALSALDCVGRQAAVDAIRATDDYSNVAVALGLGKAITAIRELPSVQPQRMRGRWAYLDYGCVGNYHCTACRRICVNKGDYDFCPFCGADMRGTE